MKTRPVARAIAVNENGEILLVHYKDIPSCNPQRTGLESYWVLPGGGLEANETFEQAALRELEEETGIQSSIAGPCVWTREVILRFEDQVFLQDERFFLIHVVQRSPLRNRTGNEPIHEIRWWSVNTLIRSPEVFYPEGLGDLIRQLLDGTLPSVGPRVLGA